MKNTFRKAALSTICMLIVAVMSLTGVTYAWFSQGTVSSVKGMSVEVEAAEGGIFIATNSTSTVPAADSFKSNITLNYANFGGADGVSPVSTAAGANEAWKFYTGELLSTVEIKSVEDTTGTNFIKTFLFLRNPGETQLTLNLGTEEGFVTNIKNSDAESSKAIEDAARLGIRYVTTESNPGKTATGTGSVNTNGFGIFGKSVSCGAV